ncbi:MAG: hypothetical protein B6D59_00745 [Campylobacteraceae bacterium 4484_4]|nr:MAG: hypothetical protein B6D59_00745 [Campylobacteraceae bacterium 4484_4]
MRYLFAVAAIVSEFTALSLMLQPGRNPSLLLISLLLHLFASAVMAWVQRSCIPPIYRAQRRGVVPLLTFVNFLAPVAGMLFGWLLVLWGFVKAREISYETDLDAIDPQIISDDFPVTHRIFGEGALATLLQNRFVPTASKIKALSLLSRIQSASSMEMIRQTLSDSNDEVRLVGFSMIDKREKAMNEKIGALLEMIKESRDPDRAASLHKELAFTYWELLFQGLVDVQLAHYIEKSVHIHLEVAKERIREDTSLYKLEGRLYMRQKEYAQAKEAFVRALDLGIREAEIASYMAEISFLELNFSRVSYWMEKIPEHTLDYQLLSLAAVWRERRGDANAA